MSWYQKWVLSFLLAGLSIAKTFAMESPSFRVKYNDILKAIIETADAIRPMVEDEP